MFIYLLSVSPVQATPPPHPITVTLGVIAVMLTIISLIVGTVRSAKDKSNKDKENVIIKRNKEISLMRDWRDFRHWVLTVHPEQASLLSEFDNMKKQEESLNDIVDDL